MLSEDRALREDWHSSRIEEPEAVWKEERLKADPTFLSRRCLEISGEKRAEVEVDVAVEESFDIVLNSDRIAALPASPVQLKELAIGFLIDEGIVDGLEDIASIRHENKALKCETRNGKANLGQRLSGAEVAGLKKIQSDVRMEAGTISSAVDLLNQSAKIWRRTGATHISMICDLEGRVLASCEDVSRSSSVDKTIGAALLSGHDLSKCALITSGRLSVAMVAKAARAGFSILISKSAPMNSGVELAERIGLTLIGFARGPNLYVYSGAERVL